MKSLVIALCVWLTMGHVQAKDIVDTARASGQFTTLLTALSATGLDRSLSKSGPFTVFAPTDEAFAQLPAGTLETLLANPELLKKILLYHVVSGATPFADLKDGSTLTSLHGHNLAVFINSKTTLVGGAKVVARDIIATNGIIHVIDSVLIPSARSTASIKRDLVTLAQSFQGLGDPDFSRQIALQKLVSELLSLTAVAPVSERLSELKTCWQQVWGPYDYRNNRRGVDPLLKPDEIYQCVFDGHYYNVNRQFKNGNPDLPRITLLRGRYHISAKEPNDLVARFTNLYSVKNDTTQVANIYDLAPLAEKGKLRDRLRTLPQFLVRLLFGGGTLREIYTDKDIRILLGSNKGAFKNSYLYIMTRVPQ